MERNLIIRILQNAGKIAQELENGSTICFRRGVIENIGLYMICMN